MPFDQSQFWPTLAATFRDPRGMARALIRLDLPVSTGLLALALMAVLSALLTTLALHLAPLAPDPDLEALFSSPVAVMAMQGAVLVLTAALAYGVGRAFGGQGRFADALVLMAWIEAVLLLLQIAQIVILLILPPLADLAGIAAILAFLWLMTQFVAELHGFRSAGMVLLGLIATVILISLALAVVAVAVLGFGA